MDSELKKVMDDYQKGARGLVNWASKMLKTPYAETEDGQEILGLVAQIAGPSALLMMKASIMMMEDTLLRMRNDT